MGPRRELMIVTRTHKELEDVLMEPKAKGVTDAYFVIRGDGQNVTIVPSGLNGVEYNKTHGHFHKYLGAEIYTCLYGQGLVLMQRNDEAGEPKEFRVISLHSGKQVEVPAGFGHTLVNISKEYLVVLDNAPNFQGSHDYEPVKDKKGLAYYVVEKKGEIAFEENPNYRVHPQISSE